MKKLEEADLIHKNDFDILCNHGNALLWLAKVKLDMKTDTERAVKLLELASTKFRSSLLLK